MSGTIITNPVEDVCLVHSILSFSQIRRDKYTDLRVFNLAITDETKRVSVYKPICSILGDKSELHVDYNNDIYAIPVKPDKLEEILSKAIDLLDGYYFPGEYEVVSIDWTGVYVTLINIKDGGKSRINFKYPIEISDVNKHSFKLKYNRDEPAEYLIKGSPVDLRNFKVAVDNKDPITVTFTDVDTKKRTFNLAGILVHYNKTIREDDLTLETVGQKRKSGSRHLVKISGLGEKDYYFPLSACDKKFLLCEITDFLNDINVLVHHHCIKAFNDEMNIGIPTTGIFMDFQVDKSFQIKDLGDRIKIIAKNRSECFAKDSDWNFHSFKNRLFEVYHEILDKYPKLKPNAREKPTSDLDDVSNENAGDEDTSNENASDEDASDEDASNEESEDINPDATIESEIADNKADSIGIQITKNLCYISAADRNIMFRKNKFISCYSDENTITILLEPNNHIKLSVLNITGHEVVKKIYDAMSD